MSRNTNSEDFSSSSDDECELSQEIQLFENNEIKTGVVKCDKTIMSIGDKKIDFLNIDLKIASSIVSENENKRKSRKRPRGKQQKSIVILQLENINNPSLNYLGQLITTQILGKNYQAIPCELLVYQENDLRQLQENSKQEDQSHILIIVCPTDCKGGTINFPEFKRKVCGQKGKEIIYALFGIENTYEVLKVTKGYRVLITYRILKNSSQVREKELAILDTEKLTSLLRDRKEKNILIPITEDNVIEKICIDMDIEYLEVYGEDKCPDIVYSDLMSISDASYEKNKFGMTLKFKHLVEYAFISTPYRVGFHVNLPNPKMISEEYDQEYTRGSRTYTYSKTMNYYSFILINPDN